jgi:type II secretory pathway pseudopilin PulG
VNRPRQPVWYSLVAILVCVLAVTVGGYVVLDRSARDRDRAAKAAAAQAERVARAAARESEQRWCSLITTMDDAYRIAPPQTEIGRKLAQDIGDLRLRFGCPPRT